METIEAIAFCQRTGCRNIAAYQVNDLGDTMNIMNLCGPCTVRWHAAQQERERIRREAKVRTLTDLLCPSKRTVLTAELRESTDKCKTRGCENQALYTLTNQVGEVCGRFCVCHGPEILRELERMEAHMTPKQWQFRTNRRAQQDEEEGG